MNHTKMQQSRNIRRREAGLSLIELMIGLVLGLLVVSALFNIYVGTSRSSEFSNGIQTMQENGRHGTATLRQGIRHAGYSPGDKVEPFDLDNGSATSIAVRLVAERDCNGESTGAAGIAVNTYALDENNKQITCTGNSGATATAMPLIDGVEEFRILYGIDTDGDEFRYADTYVKFDKTIDPFTVSAIRFAILVNSGSAIRTRPVQETHVVLDEEVTTNDRIARHVFTSTVLLRNGIEDLK